MKQQQVLAFDRDLTHMLERDFPQQPMQIRHRVWGVLARKPE
jgi:hypothetical protein